MSDFDPDSLAGTVIGVNGPVVQARTVRAVGMSELLWVGTERLVGEVIGLVDNEATVQVYEDTVGLTPGAPIYATGLPLYVELGPGLLGTIFDGIQRPLDALAAHSGDFIGRGVARAAARPQHGGGPSRRLVAAGDTVTGGEILGARAGDRRHRAPRPRAARASPGTLAWVAERRRRTRSTTSSRGSTATGVRTELRLYHRWPVRHGRTVPRRVARRRRRC